MFGKMGKNLRARWRASMFADTLVRELALVLLIKGIVLYGLWVAFFKSPSFTTLSTEDVSNVLVTSGQPSNSPVATRTELTTTREAGHD